MSFLDSISLAFILELEVEICLTKPICPPALLDCMKGNSNPESKLTVEQSPFYGSKYKSSVV
ncbi:hypothetical protein GcM1_04330 [Golovinomyces cichoracearum]|uniref:Uncharacterized protein n=1 Tax=Golovinomyces cichoracearum TaxID=62708 RepID=A0A420IUP4_9PEZI|nr:hypothetical protein GcM1_04330 [Golovinomyces cichoracearum]